MAKKNALGSGLGELLGEVQNAYEKNLSEYTESIIELSVDIIQPNPFQPRKSFDSDALNDLADSIVEHGLLQPILVYDDEGEYFLIAGERRLRASKIAGKSTIKAVVANEYIDRSRLRELAIIENIQRENLNPLDLAHSYQELINEYKITHEELAAKLKKSRAQITNTMRILELCGYVQDLIVQNKITQGHAKVMVGLEENEQKVLADSIVGQRLSVRETEQLVKDLKHLDPKNKHSVTKKQDSSADSKVLKELLAALTDLGVQAKISQGKVIIQPKKDAIIQLIKKLKS
ncbi:ParB/RepB/Spo0J family partition protein [Helicobacter canis]|uniref:ParB/RepB/Spo0J family partition protein n=1 Tax=Helicobacter canis TaxID=29419 RepID=A0A5M9QLK7_9HELI|nr:ParB/RepB/Spo0J family partition protein [Helicobacter canis]KAA8708532.1 ParB/RepB/Spo0J family partition protein [Helicobacter canis]